MKSRSLMFHRTKMLRKKAAFVRRSSTSVGHATRNRSSCEPKSPLTTIAMNSTSMTMMTRKHQSPILVIVSFEATNAHKLPDHHNVFGELW